MTHPEETLTPVLERFAKQVVDRHLEAPAVFFLELHKPFTTLFHTGALLLEPIATPFFGTERIENLEKALSKREHIEELISIIESYSIAKRHERRNNRPQKTI